ADVFEGPTEALSPMRSHQHYALVTGHAGQWPLLPIVGQAGVSQEGVDHGISRHDNPRICLPLTEQGLSTALRRGEQKLGNDICDAAVHFLWKRTIGISSAK